MYQGVFPTSSTQRIEIRCTVKVNCTNIMLAVLIKDASKISSGMGLLIESPDLVQAVHA